jgi:thiamine kinase-like enzyme
MLLDSAGEDSDGRSLRLMTIEEVVERMGWTAAPSLTITPLEGGITNLNYRVQAGSDAYVVRIPGRDSVCLGIDRGREHACTAAAHESGVAPAVVAYLAEAGVLVTRFVPGRGLAAEEMRDPATLHRVAGALRCYHEGRHFPGTFSPFRAAREYLAAAEARGAPMPGRVNRMLAHAARLEAALGEPRVWRPCHNDLLTANFLDDGERLWIVDWEYAAMGDPLFDLGNFAAHHQLSDAAEQTLLRAYFGRVPAGAAARLKLMKMASDLREAMWAIVQAAVSSLRYDFAGYGRRHLDRYAAQMGDPRLAAWLAEAAHGASEGTARARPRRADGPIIP